MDILMTFFSADFAGDLGSQNSLVARHAHSPLWQMCQLPQIWKNPTIHMQSGEGWVAMEVHSIAQHPILAFHGHLLLASQRKLPTEALLQLQ
jgi:hypothetical protein